MDETIRYAVVRLQKFNTFLKTNSSYFRRLMQDKITVVVILLCKLILVIVCAFPGIRVIKEQLRRVYRKYNMAPALKIQCLNTPSNVALINKKLANKAWITESHAHPLSFSTKKIRLPDPVLINQNRFVVKANPIQKINMQLQRLCQGTKVKSAQNIVLPSRPIGRWTGMMAHRNRKKKIRMRRGFRRIKFFKRLRYMAVFVALAHRFKALSSHKAMGLTNSHRHVHDSLSEYDHSSSKVINPFAFFKRSDENQTAFTSSQPAHIFKRYG